MRFGEYTGGQVPYGYRVADDGTHLVEHAGEQEVVAAIRELRAGGLSLRAVVAELGKRGMVARSGKPLGLTQVVRIIAAEPQAKRDNSSKVKRKDTCKPGLQSVRDHWSTRLGVDFPVDQCWCCGKICLLSRAHLKAHRDGGSGDVSNLVIACRNCNNWVDIEYTKHGEAGIVEWILSPFRKGKYCAPASAMEIAWQHYDPAVPLCDVPSITDQAFIILSHTRKDFQHARRDHTEAKP